jgi:hypothetical protein
MLNGRSLQRRVLKVVIERRNLLSLVNTLSVEISSEIVKTMCQIHTHEKSAYFDISRNISQCKVAIKCRPCNET